MGNEVTVTGMNEKSIQGDRAILDWAEELNGAAQAVSIDVSHSPDLVPPAAVWAALRPGTTRLTNAGRLRIKESDRLATVTEVLNALGGEVQEEVDRLIIHGRPVLKGGAAVSAHNDHRIAMMAAVAATCCEQPVTVLGAECVAKSYPNFWEDYEMLGGHIAWSEG